MIILRQKSFTSLRESKKLVRMVGKSAAKDAAAGLAEPSKKTRDLLRKVERLDKLRGPNTESGKKAFEKFDSNLENILDKAEKKFLRRQKGFSEIKAGQSRIMLCRDPETGEKYEMVETWDGKKWVEGKRLDRSNSASFRDADDFASSVMSTLKKKKTEQKSFSRPKEGFCIFTDGDEIVGYNTYTAEKHTLRSKNFSLGYRIRKARATYRDVLEAQSDPKYREGQKEEAKEWLRNAMEESKFDDKNRKIIYPGGHEATFKDDLRYQVAKEDQQRASRKVLRDAQKYNEEVNSNKSPKSIARSAALKALTRRYSVLDGIENYQNSIQDEKIKLNKKIFKNSKIGKIGRNNLEAQKAQMTTGTKNLKVLFGKE